VFFIYYYHCESRISGVKQSLVKIHVYAIEPEIAVSLRPKRRSSSQWQI